jgi:hypothetical protein
VFSEDEIETSKSCGGIEQATAWKDAGSRICLREKKFSDFRENAYLPECRSQVHPLGKPNPVRVVFLPVVSPTEALRSPDSLCA